MKNLIILGKYYRINNELEKNGELYYQIQDGKRLYLVPMLVKYLDKKDNIKIKFVQNMIVVKDRITGNIFNFNNYYRTKLKQKLINRKRIAEIKTILK